MAALNPKFFLFQFSKISFLLFVSVYLWFPAGFFFGRFGGFSDALMPFEVALCIGASIITLGWGVKLILELIRK